MCERSPKSSGWQGWSELPPTAECKPVGEWIDLTHRLSPTMPCASIFPEPQFGKIRSLPADPFNVTDIHMVAHAGTHVDAPLHFLEDGPDMASIPINRLTGTGVVWHVEIAPEEVIEPSHLEQCRPLVQEGDIVAVDTGWAKLFGTETYERHPSFSAESAAWMVDRGIKLLACDFATPDLVYHRREVGFNWPVHHQLLSRGILICEHLTGHSKLAGERVHFEFGALPIVGGDGSPARVLARRIA